MTPARSRLEGDPAEPLKDAAKKYAAWVRERDPANPNRVMFMPQEPVWALLQSALEYNNAVSRDRAARRRGRK